MSASGPGRFVLLCGLASIALHALVFAARPVEKSPPVHVQPKRPGSVLLVPPPPAADLRAAGAGAGAEVEPIAAVEDQVELPVAAPETAAPVSVAQPGSPGEGGYLPRPMLSVAPQPLQPVMLTWPEFEGTQKQYQGVLALYIDDQGVVQRIRALEGDLPPELEAHARQVFAAIQFAPGQLDGATVRSRVLVEVVFEKPELPPPLPSMARGVER